MQRRLNISSVIATSVFAMLAAAAAGGAALAQDGFPDPNSTANTFPAPQTGTPTDPAAGDNPMARVPTARDNGVGYQAEGVIVGTPQGIVELEEDQVDN
ncbi:hypothetical protein [Hyphomicrobium sp. D-2]|uniref:hypothetical protein n=1 Tax=Hyphomicrobium sp. D-2 TaxID=3041621 RepID=UPI00245549E9|nr:hypothetical protein [Hyphomicrobium sp. D-2]MDH4983011.1 hypothetical protein [Hyphomicrobium sp. D-2]